MVTIFRARADPCPDVLQDRILREVVADDIRDVSVDGLIVRDALPIAFHIRHVEIDYLLQRMEQFDGVAILATNRKGDLDSAFLRRLRFAIDFAPPTVDERERLTGAGVKSAALAAASIACAEQAPVEMRHVLAAGRRELAKQGLVVRPRVTG